MDGETLAQNRQKLLHFLDAEIDSLTGILRVYARRAGLNGGEDDVAELLNAVVVEALSHAQRFDPTRPPRAWLLGIAANLVRRRQAHLTRLNQREPLAGDLTASNDSEMGEDELFDRLVYFSNGAANRSLHQRVEQRDSLAGALALLTVEERRLIRLFTDYQLDGDSLATALNVKPGAARVRLHRALAHLRQVWRLNEENESHD